LIITSSRADSIQKIIEALEKLGPGWNLKLNKAKSAILTRESITQIGGINCTNTSKYLGVKLHTDGNEQDKAVRKSIKQTLPFIAKRLRSLDPSIKEHLICTLARSLLIYHGTPMVSAEIWKHADIRQLECQLYRESSAISNQVCNEAVINVLQYCAPVWEVVSRLAKQASLRALNQKGIRGYFEAT
jgi:hypothetical protein